LLDIVREYGEHSLPLLFEKHPQMRKEMIISQFPPRRLLDYVIAFVCSPPVFFLVKLAEKLAFKFPFIYNYLIFRSYREGYLASQKSKVKSEK
jgi:hypothetical protein